MRKELINEMNDRKMNEILLPDEAILWQGFSEKAPVVNEGNRKSLLIRWIICGVCCIALSWVYAVMAPKFSVVAVTVIVLLCAYVAFLPILDERRATDKCTFYVTDRRLVTVVDGRDTYEVEKENLEIRMVPANEAGCIHVLAGECIGLPEKKYVISAAVPKKDDKAENTTGLVFYRVRDSRELKNCL